MNSKHLLLSLLAGIAIGATLGVLYAPDKGTATRMKITQKGQDYTDELTAKFNEVINQITEKIDSISDEAMKIANNGQSNAHDTTSRMSDKPDLMLSR